jgi:hypothetical protein
VHTTYNGLSAKMASYLSSNFLVVVEELCKNAFCNFPASDFFWLAGKPQARSASAALITTLLFLLFLVDRYWWYLKYQLVFEIPMQLPFSALVFESPFCRVFIKVVGTSFPEMFAANDWELFQSCFNEQDWKSFQSLIREPWTWLTSYD